MSGTRERERAILSAHHHANGWHYVAVEVATMAKNTVPGYYTLEKLDPLKLVAYVTTAHKLHIKYGLGAKAAEKHLTDYPPTYPAIDCSGFVRAAIAYATGGATVMPDGSVVQRDWCDAKKFKVTDQENCKLLDGHVRIAFLSPADALRINGDHAGHVMLVHNGMTLESHYPTGPDRRAWGSRPWMEACKCYVLY